MGKGGTKFESEAIGVRSGRQKRGPSFKDMKKEMEDFQKTGKHPALDGAHTHVLPSLPVRDPNRPHVFLSFASGKTDLGRILVEVFEPELPVTCRNFLNRCNPGAGNSFKGTKVDRVIANYALYGGISKGHKGAQQRRNEYLRHVQSGLVSVSLSGDAFAVTFDRALTLDDTHQVVGRVHGEASLRVVERLNTTAVGLNDEPINSMRVADCGQTDSDGNYDPLLAGSRRKESAEAAAARLKEEGAQARSAVGYLAPSFSDFRKDFISTLCPGYKESLDGTALEEGLAQKRKPSSEQIKAVGPKRAKKGLAFESESDISEEDSQDNKSSD